MEAPTTRGPRIGACPYFSRRATQGAVIALGALLAALVAAELVLHLLPARRSWNAGGNHPRFLFEPDAAAGYRLRPGFRGRSVAASGEFALEIEIGADGKRAQSRPFGEQTGILVRGDSMTFGEGVPAERSWTALLSAARREPVINAGVPGYSSAQMAAGLAADIDRYRPAGVFFLVSPRWDLARCRDPFAYKEGFIVLSSYAPRLRLVGDELAESWLIGRSRIARHFAARRAVARRAEPARWSEHPECLAGLRSGNALAGAHGAPFLAVLIDSPARGHATDARDLAALLERDAIPHLELDTALPDGAADRRYPIDGHWNERGHREVAAALAALPKSAAPRDR